MVTSFYQRPASHVYYYAVLNLRNLLYFIAKRKCGMGLVTAKLRETAAHVIAMSVLVLNLRKIQCAFLQFLTYLLAVFPSKEKWAIVQ